MAYQRIYFFTFSIINISNFFFKMTVWIEKIYFFSFLWYKSSFYNLYFDSWKYEEKRRDQFNDSPTMPEPRHVPNILGMIKKNIWPPGGWSWRLTRYRYNGHTPIFLHICLNVGFLWLWFQFSHQKWYLTT